MGQWINVYTDHKNLIQDGLGLTSNRVAHRKILCEEYGPKIIYIKGFHNTVADAISGLDYDPKVNSTNEHNHAMQNVSTKGKTGQKWLMFSKFWSCYSEVQDGDEANVIHLNHVFANCSE